MSDDNENRQLELQLQHIQKMYELQTGRIKAIGEYNKNIAEAMISVATAQGKFIDNTRKVWSLQALKLRKVEMERQAASIVREFNWRNLRHIRSSWLRAGDQMTQNVMHAWTALHDLINRSDDPIRDALLELYFSPECTNLENYILLGPNPNRTYVPPNRFQPVNSLQLLAYRLQYYHFAPKRGTPPHQLVVEGLLILSKVDQSELTRLAKEIEDVNEERRKFLDHLASEGSSATIPDPKNA